MTSPTRVSAVIACYRDAQAIPLMHERLCAIFSSLNVDYEIIFVNDGSPDDTDAVLRTLAAKDAHVLAIEHSRNFGSQNAFISGMQAATGDAVVLLDGDLQDPPEVIPAFVEKWHQGNDVVYGRRGKREGSALMATLYKAFYRVFRRVCDVDMPVDAGDFSLLDRRVVDQLLAFPEADQFLRGLRAWVGFKQAGVDYVRPQRPFGRSTHSWLKNIWWAKKAIVSFSSYPIEALGYAAATMTVLSLLATIYLLVDWLRRPYVPHGTAMLVVLVIFFGSLNLLAIAVVGEYVMKAVDEAKRRPKFIRKAIRHGENHWTGTQAIESFLAARKPGHTGSANEKGF